jgi:hypothetical protein
MPDYENEQFERYLKNFRPVEPEALPHRIVANTGGNKGGIRRRVALAFTAVSCLAAATVVSLVFSRGSLRMVERVPPQTAVAASSVEVSVPVLTRLALDDHETFVEHMTRKAESQFPAMKSEQSALRVLAK